MKIADWTMPQRVLVASLLALPFVMGVVLLALR